MIEKKHLIKNLEFLKHTIKNYNYNHLTNVIFINSYAMYLYLSKIICPLDKKYTIGSLIDEIEECIPAGLSNETIDLFLELFNDDELEQEKNSKLFVYNCKLEFINLIRNVEDEESWQHIIESCDNMRRYKVSL